MRLDSRGLITDEVVFDDATLETKPVVSTAGSCVPIDQKCD